MKQILRNLFSIFKPRKKADPPPAPAPSVQDEDDEVSAIKRLKKLRDFGIPDLTGIADEVPKAFNRETAIKAIFQRTMDDFVKTPPKSDGGIRRGFAEDESLAEDAASAQGKPRGNRSRRGSALNSATMSQSVMNDTVLTHYQNRGFIGWQTCAILAQHEIINRACSIPAEDAIAHGYHLSCSTDEKGNKDEKMESNMAEWLVGIKRASDKMGINDVCVQLNYKKKVFGVGLAVPRIKDADYTQPFNIDGIKPGSYQGFAVVDPYWLIPEFDDASQSDPTSPDFYEPAYFLAPNGNRIHKSWVIRVVNAHVPDVLKPTYYFGGIPLPQMIYERMFCADKIANEAPLLAMTKRLLIADANVEELYHDKNHAKKMLEAINYFRDNFSIFFKKPGAQVQQIDTALGEFDQLIMTQYQLVACIAQMPAPKLLKVTPTGFQSTGDYEWKDYAQALLDIQNNDYMPLLERHYQILIRSAYPDRKDLHVNVEFNPIDVRTKEENSTVEARIAQFCSSLVQAGAVTPDEVRTLLRREDQGMFNFLNPVMPDILKRMMEAKDPANAQQPGAGGMPGMPPMGGGAPDAGGEAPMPQPEAPQPDNSGEQYSAAFTEAVKQADALVKQNGGTMVQPEGAEGGGGGEQPQSQEGHEQQNVQ